MHPEPDENALRKARSRLLRLLSYRGRSRREAEEYLQKKDYDTAVIKAVIEEMEQWGYIDDRSYTCEFMESCLRRGWGPMRARYILRSKGIDKKTVEEGLENYYSLEDEQVLAQRVLAKRSAPGAEQDESWIRRQVAFLQRRGFHDQVIMKAVRERCLFFNE